MRSGLHLDASLSFLTTKYNARPCDLKKSSKSSKLLHGAQFSVFTSLPVHFKIKSTPPTRQDDCVCTAGSVLSYLRYATSSPFVVPALT